MLASLIRRNVDYLDEVLRQAAADPEPLVTVLAAAAANRADAEFTAQCEKRLHSGDFNLAWPVLMMLRVVPIVALVGPACDLLADEERSRTAWGYDGLFALANPEMAEAARGELLNRIGMQRLATIAVEHLRGSNGVAVDAFASLMAALDPTEAAGAVAAAAQSTGADSEVVRQILNVVHGFAEGEGAGELFVAGYASDEIAVDIDDIGISQDVETLAAVMMAREVKPPLAIGLFGA